MGAPPEGPGTNRTGAQQLRLVYETRVRWPSRRRSATPVAMLESICRALEWEYGALWSVDRAGMVLRCDAIWHQPTPQFDEFTSVSRKIEFAPGVGMPGRVWASRRSAWIPTSCTTRTSPGIRRRPGGPPQRARLPDPPRCEVLGVMEFFSRGIRQPDRTCSPR